MEEHHYLVPAQPEGLEKNIAHRVTAISQEDAEDWFLDAKEKLLDVNNWKRYAKEMSATFRLADVHGKALSRQAHKGDHIIIDTGAPDTDRLTIEAIEYDDYPDIDMETLALRVGSAATHDLHNYDTAHLLSNNATCTFVIERRGMHLCARYYGHNGITGKDDTVSAWSNIPDTQWDSLVKGLLG